MVERRERRAAWMGGGKNGDAEERIPRTLFFTPSGTGSRC